MEYNISIWANLVVYSFLYALPSENSKCNSRIIPLAIFIYKAGVAVSARIFFKKITFTYIIAPTLAVAGRRHYGSDIDICTDIVVKVTIHELRNPF